jgi:hypothetical protein
MTAQHEPTRQTREIVKAKANLGSDCFLLEAD